MTEENDVTSGTYHVFAEDKVVGDAQRMRIGWPGDLEQNRKLLEGVTLANQLLSLELGKSQASAAADWTHVHDHLGRPLLQLTLTDLFTKDQVIERFAYEEFGDRKHLEARMHRMWGNLLRARSGALLKSLEELIVRSGG